MSRSDNTDWHRKRNNSNMPSWRNIADWNAWRTDRGNRGHGKDCYLDWDFPCGRGQEARRHYWKAERSRIREQLRRQDPWLGDDPAPSRTRNSVKYDYW